MLILFLSYVLPLIKLRYSVLGSATPGEGFTRANDTQKSEHSNHKQMYMNHQYILPNISSHLSFVTQKHRVHL